MPSDIALLIVSALNFKASWSYVFDENDRRQLFTKTDGRKVRIPMLTRLSQQQTVAKFKTQIFGDIEITAVAIPYEVFMQKLLSPSQFFNDYIFMFLFLQDKNGQFEMIIIMPDNHRGLDFFQSAALLFFDNPSTANILDDALFVLDKKRKFSSSEEYIITMPAFTVDTYIDAKKYFKEVKLIYDELWVKSEGNCGLWVLNEILKK